MKKTSVYIFAGHFKDREEACSYSESQWEPEPDQSVSDEEYSEWEDRNPTHKLKKNISSYLDEDFIETVEVDYQYLSNFNLGEENIAKVKVLANEANYFVLVFNDALDGFKLESQPESNSILTYCGHYECTL